MPSLEIPDLSQSPDLSATSTVSDADLSEARFLQEPAIASEVAAPSQFWCSWKVFGSTFLTIFLAELGDKTQVATLLMSAEFHAPWTVFAGAAIALITTSLLGVLVGQWLSKRLSPRTLDTAAGITLALIAIGLFWDVLGMS
jgi:putative Ca2+/H+ antiporter (TMEM165/GDT1 family)